jgi:ketosteroid isomerase-like protein
MGFSGRPKPRLEALRLTPAKVWLDSATARSYGKTRTGRPEDPTREDVAMTEAEKLALAERFVVAVETGDIDAVTRCYAPDAKIWHNFDDVEQTVEQNLKVLAWIHRKLPDRRYRVLAREALKDGVLQQHVLEATLPDGTPWRMAACLVVRMADGRITRLDEYLDSAQSAALTALGR